MKYRLVLFAGFVLALAYLLPNHYPPWAAFHADLLAAVAFAPLVLWALLERGSLPTLALGAVLLSVIPLAQVATDQIYFAGDGWMAWLYVTGFALTVIAGARFVSSSSAGSTPLTVLAPLLTGLLLAALASVGIAIHQWLNLQQLGLFIVDLGRGDRPFANLAQPNQLATLLLLGVTSIAFLYESRIVRSGVAIAAALVMAFGLAMTESRTILVAVCVLWAAYLALRRRASLRMTPVALSAPTLLFVLTTLAWPALNRVLLLPHTSSLADRIGENLRLTLWQAMLDALARAPWFGYGWNQVPLAQQATAPDYPALRYFFDSSHNLFLDLALWNGLPVALLIAAGLALWFWRRAVACRDPLSWCLLLAVTLVFCHAMVEYPLAYAYFLLPVGFLMGALNPVGALQSKWWNTLTLPRPLIAMLGFAAGVMFVTVVAEYLPLEEQWRQIRFEQGRIGEPQVQTLINTRLLTQLREHARFARTQPVPDMTPGQLEWMRRVAERYGWASNSFKYAQALAFNGQPEAAALSLLKLCKMEQPRICAKAIDEWRSLSVEKYPELRKITLPVAPAP